MALEYLLISDIDDTLLGDDAALKRFRAYQQELGNRLVLAYATGRTFESVARDVAENRLPAPIAVIGNVGSEIRHFESQSVVDTWTRDLAGTWSAAKVRQLLQAEDGLKPQPESAQSEHKVSYFYEKATPQQLEALRDQLARGGIQADYVYSSERDLDFLPKGVNKGTAAAFLARELGFKLDRVLVAGNSANDDALFQIGCAGIVVANAHPEWKSRLENQPHVYLAQGRMADGVREGLDYWLSRKEGLPSP